MPPKKSSAPRTQPLSMRVDDRTRFLLDFISRIEGSSLTTIVDRAVRQYATNITVENQLMPNEPKNWSHYWYLDEGFRTLKIILDPDIRYKFTTIEEERLAQFVETHSSCFFDDTGASAVLSPDKIAILWPQIDSLVAEWVETRHIKVLSVLNKMRKILLEAGVKEKRLDYIPPYDSQEYQDGL